MTTTTVINLTPHPITLTRDGVETILPPHAPKGEEPRVGATPGIARPDHPLAGIVGVHAPDVLGEVLNLPDPQPGVYFVVSGLVGEALRKQGLARPDVLVPGTAPQDGAVRNTQGHIVAVTRLKEI